VVNDDFASPMPRNIHDSFAKECMKELLADFGEVEIESQIAGEIRTIDLVFRPYPESLPSLQALGLLGRMAAEPCLIEPFRNPVPAWEVRNCRGKLFDLEAANRRQAKQNKRRLSTLDLPFLWILSPTVSRSIKKDFQGLEKSNWGEGIYFLVAGDRTAIVAIHDLPKTLDTLWLRLLGRGKVQSEAIAELIALPGSHPYRQQAIQHLAVLQIHLKTRQNKTKDVREVIMSLSPVYEKWRQETLAEGRQEGRQEGVQEGIQEGIQEERRSLALKMLQENFPPETIARLSSLSLSEIEQLKQQIKD
jgi:hypothetical protein